MINNLLFASVFMMGGIITLATASSADTITSKTIPNNDATLTCPSGIKINVDTVASSVALPTKIRDKNYSSLKSMEVSNKASRSVNNQLLPSDNKIAQGNNSVNAVAYPLYRYYNASTGDHFYTTNYNELKCGGSGYVFEAIQSHIFKTQYSGTAPLYRYWNATISDHFYTTNWNELGPGRYGYAYEGIQGYIYPSVYTGTVALYRYWNATVGDHFYTTNWNELGYGKNGYVYEGIQGYVYPTQ